MQLIFHASAVETEYQLSPTLLARVILREFAKEILDSQASTHDGQAILSEELLE
jgi:hypothetical protein